MLSLHPSTALDSTGEPVSSSPASDGLTDVEIPPSPSSPGLMDGLDDSSLAWIEPVHFPLHPAQGIAHLAPPVAPLPVIPTLPTPQLLAPTIRPARHAPGSPVQRAGSPVFTRLDYSKPGIHARHMTHMQLYTHTTGEDSHVFGPSDPLHGDPSPTPASSSRCYHSLANLYAEANAASVSSSPS